LIAGVGRAGRGVPVDGVAAGSASLGAEDGAVSMEES
jgi:hypothetical protein